MAVETIGIAILTAVIYAVIGYAKSVNEDFSFSKFGATIVLGLIIGIIMYSSGIPITEANVAEQFVAYGGLLYVVENILKALYRRIKK